MRILLATLVAFSLLLPATAAAQGPPTVTTEPADPVGATTATLNGTVDPNGAPALYHFEYGPTTAYGAATTPEAAGSGDAPLAVQATIAGLSPARTYHVRLVANGVAGADRTFTTAPLPPAVPGISRLSAVDRTPTSARLTARVDANRSETSYHVEWGTTTRLGSRTPDATIPARDGGVPVSVPLAGLPAHTRIYWRVVATNAAGVKRSGTASFTTLRAPTGITLGLFPDVTDWGGTVSVSGRVHGAGVNGLTVALEQATFPYTAGFQEVATVRSNKAGDFRFPARPVHIATRFRAVTRTAVSVGSSGVEALVRPRVAVGRTSSTRRSVRLTGVVNPALPAGRATLQRRSRSGGWSLVRRKALATLDASTSTYGFTVRRARRAAFYRVKVTAGSGAYLGATSRSLLVGKRRARR
jgi:hypothetical protein